MSEMTSERERGCMREIGEKEIERKMRERGVGDVGYLMTVSTSMIR